MKSLLTVGLLVLSFSSFATSLTEAIRAVEIQRNAICEKTDHYSMKRCFGIPQTCYYNLKYRCDSQDKDFGLTVKMKDVYSFSSSEYVTSVRKVKITN